MSVRCHTVRFNQMKKFVIVKPKLHPAFSKGGGGLVQSSGPV